MKSRSKRVAITLGDPFGVGPEVVVKSLRRIGKSSANRFVVIGDFNVFKYYGGSLNSSTEFIHIPLIIDFKKNIGKNSRAGGQAAVAYLDKAIELIRAGNIHSLVTAPLSKEAVALSYPNFQGHTEHLAHAFGIKDVEMMFVAEKIKTIIATRHIPLTQVVHSLTPANIYKTIVLTQRALKRLFKIKEPRIGVCGINPHAGEGGLLGSQDTFKVLPAIKKARRNKIKVSGPLPADTAFTLNSRRQFDAIIAMYHDQGLAPIKALYFNRLVNLTIGLPFIRTSPAHGTAFDIAGKNKADPTSMTEAIQLATKLS